MRAKTIPAYIRVQERKKKALAQKKQVFREIPRKQLAPKKPRNIPEAIKRQEEPKRIGLLGASIREEVAQQAKVPIRLEDSARQMVREQAAQTAREARSARAKAKEKRNLDLGKARNMKTLDGHTRISSSWVDGIQYDEPTKTLSAILNGVVYHWRPIEKKVYTMWWAAFAACRTDDPSSQHRWWKGKIPSHGAAWHYLVSRFLRGKRV